MNWNNTVFDPHDEGRYGSLEIGVATSQKPGLMSTADKAALGAASAASAEIPQIKQTIEDNELTVAAALNDLNSRLLELASRITLLESKYFYYSWYDDYLLAGVITRNETSFIVKVYGDPDHDYFANFHGDGQMVSFETFHGAGFEDLSSDLETQLERRYNQQIDSITLIECPVNQNEYIQNWNEYINIS